MTITRTEWQAEKDAQRLRDGSWGFDPLMPWHVANWRERVGIVIFQGIMWGGVFPAILIGGVLLIGSIGEGLSIQNAEHDRCLKHATNGYEIRQCR